MKIVMFFVHIFAIWVAFEWDLSYAERKDLNIMGFLPMTGKLFRGGPACLLAANMALKQVNERDDILEGFQLNFEWRDSKVRTPTTGIKFKSEGLHF